MSDSKPFITTQIKVTLPPSLSSAQPGPNAMVMSKKNLQELVKTVDPNEQLDEDVEEVLLSYAEDFMDSLVSGACGIAKHRSSGTVDSKDIQSHLERSCNIWVPGFGTEELKAFKRQPTVEVHKQRMSMIKKAIKKY